MYGFLYLDLDLEGYNLRLAAAMVHSIELYLDFAVVGLVTAVVTDVNAVIAVIVIGPELAVVIAVD